MYGIQTLSRSSNRNLESQNPASRLSGLLAPVTLKNHRGYPAGNPLALNGAPRVIRTPGLRIRSPALYPLSYGRILEYDPYIVFGISCQADCKCKVRH